ncbi:MAG: hypothetical protein R6V55_10820 [Desulfovermiculus sp.]
MHSSLLSLRQLAKVRERPIHAHCRSLLEKAGQTVDQGTIGAPELMLWALHIKKEELDADAAHNLHEVVHMIKDKPSLVLSLLEPQEDETETEGLKKLCSEQDPTQAGMILLKHLKERMDRLVET